MLRGPHHQLPPHAQGKLVRVVQGTVFDVAVDLRPGSPARGRWAGRLLSAEKHEPLWISPGFAHGFLVLSDTADFLYKTTAWYAPEHERCIVWNDPAIGSSGRSGAGPRCGRRKDAREEGLASALR